MNIWGAKRTADSVPAKRDLKLTIIFYNKRETAPNLLF
jgi:hypothetical protein